jgi:hypothetical protein
LDVLKAQIVEEECFNNTLKEKINQNLTKLQQQEKEYANKEQSMKEAEV